MNNLTDNALKHEAITLEESEALENFIDSDDWEDEEDMPAHIRRIYEISLRHYHHGKLH